MNNAGDTTSVGYEAVLRNRAIGLFSFVHDFCRLRTKLVYSLDAYEKVLWIDDIPREPSCSCAAWIRSASSEINGLTITKPHMPPPPKLSEVLSDWVSQASIEDSSQEMPKLIHAASALTLAQVVRLPINSDDLDTLQVKQLPCKLDVF